MTASPALRRPPAHARTAVRDPDPSPGARGLSVFLGIPTGAGFPDVIELVDLADALHDLARDLVPGASARTEVTLTEVPVPRRAAQEIVLDLARREVVVGHGAVGLTRLEFDLLAHLALSGHHVVGRDELLATVWRGRPEPLGSRTIDVHVRRLRSKLAPYGLVLTTVRGVGYSLQSGLTLTRHEGRGPDATRKVS